MKVKDLRPSSYNPRKISDKKLDMLGKSMREFGDLSGIIYNRQSGNMIGGHQRLKHLDPDWEIKGGFIKTPFGDFVFREVDWPEKKEKAANIAANKHGGEWDLPKLKDLIVDIDDWYTDLELTGFEEEELKSVFGIGKTEGEGAGSKIGEMKYSIIVECEDELNQRNLLEKFDREKIKCRALIL